MKRNDDFDAMAYGLYCIFEDDQKMNRLNKKKEEIQTKLDRLIELKGLNSDEVIFISQQLDKVITHMTLILNNLITNEEYDMYLMFCNVYELIPIEKDSLSRKLMEKIMLDKLSDNSRR